MNMQSTKQKKFTHSRMKACIIRNNQDDKQNICCPHDHLHKKFSVELPSKALEHSQHHQKSIFNEQISVTLNTNTRPTFFDKDLISIDVHTLNHLLGRNNSETTLTQILLDTDAKSMEVKLMIERMLGSLRNEQKTVNSSMLSQREQNQGSKCFQLSQTLMKPYIQKEIDILQRNLEKLNQRRQDYQSMKSITPNSKVELLQGMKQMYQRQLQQLKQIDEK